MAFSIAKLNRLPKEQRDPIYRQLLPPSIFERFRIDPRTLTNEHGEPVVQGVFPPDENFACVEVSHRPGDRDCIFACQVSLDPFMHSVSLDFVVINDIFAERYNVDVDELGRDTLFGTRCRNIYEEIRASFPEVPMIKVINKADIATPEEVEAAKAFLGQDAYVISALRGDGIDEVISRAIELVFRSREEGEA